MIFTFVYSPRKGTPAASMEGQVPHDEKVRRFNALSELQNENALKNNQKFIGQTLKVLTDGLNNGTYTGRCSQNKVVVLDKPVEKGVFVNAEIIDAQPYLLIGKIK